MSSDKVIIEAVKDNVREVFASNNLKDFPEDIIDSLAKRILKGKIRTPTESSAASAANYSSYGSSTEETGSSSNSRDSEEEMMSEDETSGSDYQLVQNKRKAVKGAVKKDNGIKKPKPTDPRTSSNYYQALQTENNRYVIPAKEKPVEEKTASRPPPIIAHGLNYKEFNNAINTLANRPKYFVKMGSGRRCTIKPITEEDRKAIFEILKQMKVESFTFTPKEERKTTLVLKGVQHTFSGEEIKAALEEELEGVKIKSVTRLETPRSKAAERDLNMFIVNFDAAYNTKEIIEFKRLLNQVVHWERHIPKGISQCKRCQRFGHVASNCAQHYRCVKCSQKHGPGECARIQNDEKSKPFCVNCQQEGHPANYRGCPRYKEVITLKNRKKEQQKQKELFMRESARNYVKPGMSFSQIVSNKPNTNTNKQMHSNKPLNTNTNIPKPQQPTEKPKPTSKITQSEVDNFCTQEAKALFGCDLFALMGKINHFIPQYRKLTTLAERQSAYLQFAFNLCLGN